MFTSTQEVVTLSPSRTLELVDVRFCVTSLGSAAPYDLVSEFLDAALSDGLMFDGSSVRTAIHESDMKLILTISSAFDPFRDRKTLVVNFRSSTPSRASSRDPR